MTISEPSSVSKSTPMNVPVQPTTGGDNASHSSPHHKAEAKEETSQVTLPNNAPNKPPKPAAQVKKPARTTTTKRMTEEEMVEMLKELIGDDEPEKRFIDRQMIGSGASAKVYSCKDVRNGNMVRVFKKMDELP